MNHRSHWQVPILGGLAVGIAIGLLYSWIISPVQFYNTSPSLLRNEQKEAYILLIGEAYASEGDWKKALQRLEQLGEPDLKEAITSLTERSISEGRSISQVRSLAALAVQLGAENPAFIPFVDGRFTLPSATPTFSPATWTPAAPATQVPTFTTTPTPSPSATATLTRRPRPTSTPTAVLNYRLLAQQPICDPIRPDPQIEVIVEDDEGNGIPGVSITIQWGTETTHIYTGLKPDIGRGYADVTIKPGAIYSVQVAEGSNRVSGIASEPCNSRNGERMTSTRLVFVKIEP